MDVYISSKKRRPYPGGRGWLIYRMRFCKINQTSLLFCSHLSLYLHNIGCGSAMPNLKTKFSFVIAPAFFYICCNQVGFIWLSTDWIKLARERAMDKKKPDCSEPPYFSCFQITLYLTCKDNTFFLKKQQNKSQSVWIHNHESWLNL